LSITVHTLCNFPGQISTDSPQFTTYARSERWHQLSISYFSPFVATPVIFGCDENKLFMLPCLSVPTYLACLQMQIGCNYSAFSDSLTELIDRYDGSYPLLRTLLWQPSTVILNNDYSGKRSSSGMIIRIFLH
jgi:hypothetical protein